MKPTKVVSIESFKYQKRLKRVREIARKQLIAYGLIKEKPSGDADNNGDKTPTSA